MLLIKDGAKNNILSIHSFRVRFNGIMIGSLTIMEVTITAISAHQLTVVAIKNRNIKHFI